MGASMQGCNPSKAQKQLWDQLSDRVGCIACRVSNKPFNPHVSIHHISGRAKQDSHWHVLPLCAGHHQDGTGHPALKGLAVHPWKARFEAKYGTQDALWQQSIELLAMSGGEIPIEFHNWLESN